MKHHYLWAVAVTALLTVVGCSNEALVQQQAEAEPENVTEFAVADDVAPAKGLTRTTGIYNGSTVNFFWTAGDKLWINDPAASPALKQSVKDDINARIAANGNGRTATAKFYFPGTYTAQTYKLRYTGNGNAQNDKVTIKANQTQQTPNDASHIGTDGDCGTATATKNGGRYTFNLDHKAAYVTFMPFFSKEKLDNSVTVKGIKITANENLAGTFGFDDNGLQTASVTAPSKSVTLSLTGTFNIPQTADYTKNAAIMVVAPGIYTNFTVEYTIADSETGVTGTITKTYPSVTLNAGKNKPVRFDLSMKRYDMHYYMWDAGTHYWDGYTGTLPVKDGEQAAYPGSGTNRDFNSNATQLYAVNSCKGCPNANEASLYAFRGDPHWDGTTLWVANKHVYTGGMWFKKLKYIENGKYTSPVTIYPDGRDYRNNSYWSNWNEGGKDVGGVKWITTPTQGKPADTSQYFFLPAMGYLDNDAGKQGVLKKNYPGYKGTYWTSTGIYFVSSLQAVSLHFSETEVGLDVDLRRWAYPIFMVAEN